MAAQERLYLLDGMALAYRAYFSFITRPLLNSRGENTSAIYGFVTTLMKILEEHPDHIAVVFDTREPTFRHVMYPDYKATREKMPEDMASQLDKLKEVVRAFNTPLLELPGYEADDIMGTLARVAERQQVLTYLVTGDKDFMQLVSPLIKIYRPGKGGSDMELVAEEGVREKFGVTPDRVIDVLALIGDKSDNVPGVPGIGEKTAIPLVQKFGSLENLYEHVGDIPQKGVREKLITHRELAFLSKRLVTIDTAVPIGVDFHALRARAADIPPLLELFAELEFRTLAARIRAGVSGVTRPDPPSDQPGDSTPEGAPEAVIAPAGPPRGAATHITSDRHVYHCVMSPAELERMCTTLETAGIIAIDTETTSTDPLRAEIVGCSFAVEPGQAWYVPVQSAGPNAATGLFENADAGAARVNTAEALPVTLVMDRLRPILEDAARKKVGQNIKYDMLVFRRLGIAVRGIAFDTMVAGYVLRADTQHTLDAMVFDAFNYRMVSYDDLTGTGKNRKRITDVPLERLAEYAAEDADWTLRLFHEQEPRLRASGLLDLCTALEFPLIEVLAEMEYNGVRLDTGHLAGMSKELEGLLDHLIADIHLAAGTPFNINSTQQLGEVLFRKLGLPPVKKTKTGFSTDVSVLESLKGRHPVIDSLLEYRQLAKLKSTYVDALPMLIHPETGRVHTSFNQTVAATGRLSSSDPNLQNIPIRTEVGRAIRKAFIPRESRMLIMAADYSQIELRVMAHISGDPALTEAFLHDEDIHTTTAAKVFGVDAAGVTRDMRRKAKEVNFGIMYGIGPFGLANRLDISQGEAREIINRYFERFPGVKRYINDTLASARKSGYVETLLGRRRYIPDITSKNQNVRGNAERQAINMPIQGTAADMIKRAMINVHRALSDGGLSSRLLLQVHDELVLEIPEAEKEEVEQIAVTCMRDALPLRVPVKVDVGVGKNWLEAH